MPIWKWKGLLVHHLKRICTIVGTKQIFIEFLHSKRIKEYGIGLCIVGHSLQFKIRYSNWNKEGI